MPRSSFLDWTQNPPPPSLTPWQTFMRNVDWEKSRLGPMEGWPIQLRQMLLLIVADSDPAVIFWGNEGDDDGDGMTILYNEAEVTLLGQKHPSLQGQDPRIGLAEVWDRLRKTIIACQETGRAVQETKEYLPLERYGYWEETYFNWKFTPIIGPDGYMAGSYVNVSECTREVINDRRTLSANSIGSSIAGADTVKAIWTGLLNGLESNELDIPVALVYSVQVEGVKTPSSPGSGPQSMSGQLEGSIGLPSCDGLIPPDLQINDDSVGLASKFWESLKMDEPLLLETSTDLPEVFSHETVWRGWGLPCTSAVVCPIRQLSSDVPIGFVLIGLNPKRPYDQDYRIYIHSLIAQIATPHVSAVLLKEEMKRSKYATMEAVTQRDELSKLLRAKTLAYEQSEMKFARFADRAPVGIGIVDMDGMILYGNHVWHDITGIPIGEANSMAWLDAIVEEDRSMLQDKWLELVEQKSVVRYSTRFKKPWKTESGEIKAPYTTGLCAGFPDFDEQGNVKTIMSVVMDISELRWAEDQLRLRTQELERSEMLYRQFTDIAPIGVARLSTDGLIEYANDAWYKISGRKPDTKSTTWFDSVPINEQERLLEFFRQLKAGKGPLTFESLLWNKGLSSEPRYTLTSAFSQVDANGHVERIVCWLTDITRQKMAELNSKTRMDEALELKRQQENFIDMTSHEMRNPLSAVLHCAEEIIGNLTDGLKLANSNNICSIPEDIDSSNQPLLTLRGILDSTVEAAQTISYCVQHQRHIVDDVLTLSKLDSNLLLITPTAAVPTTIVREALKMFQAETREADITLDFVQDESLRQLKVNWVLVDPSRILQVLINLTTNAIKFTRKRETRSIVVSMAASKDKPSQNPKNIKYFPYGTGKKNMLNDENWAPDDIIYLSLSVQDTGCGLSLEEQKFLFNRFSQGSPKTHVKYGGSGLGLFISRQLVEMQGGEVGLASERGKGSTFTFFVKTKCITPPTRRSSGSVHMDVSTKVHLQTMVGHSDSTVVEDYDDILQSKIRPSPTLNASRLQMKVLVVEDNLINQKVLSKQLQRHGHIVEVANHGQEALDALRQTKIWKGDNGNEVQEFDIILMDIEMPIMSGLACVQEIRRLEAAGIFTGHVPVIAVTANVRNEHVQVALEAGMDDVITKPYKIQDILSQMHRAYKLKR